ncbi:metal ABC transporter substrate-binding protein [Candidatus Neptunochlamydia vexilliferae]|uniref:Uncharacterized protein n=1 Tax=Candidatus Neptunichlamydia vexilliferae TaxID=1651774 RepID=A0ABS0B0K7_9BACT|nr:zinc ABC transporter substrate-binding protein [Candidatus Neptunochlamydia vexilliferae]MBF5059927.1 hypothetical protein [Candidatus Neptunochlamydia vexilliferae]
MKRVLSILCLLFGLVSCQNEAPKPREKPLIVTSIPPYVSLVKELVGETMDVKSALGSNFDPHEVEISPCQMKAVQEATLFIGVGQHYEKKLIGKKKEILQLDQRIPLMTYGRDTRFIGEEAHAHSKDLHFWLGPKQLPLQVSVIARALIDLAPDNQALYEKNRKTLIDKINTLIRNTQGKLNPFEGKGIIVSHSSLGYFCADFGLVQIAVESEGKSPLPKDATEVLKAADDADVIVVFTAPQFHNKGAELIAKELNLPIKSFNPLAEDVLGTIEQLANDIQ